MTPTGVTAAHILNVGYEPTLLETRTLVLRSAGYAVESASSVEEAMQRFRGGHFDVVILCHSIPEQGRERLVWLIREHGSATPVIFVSSRAASADRFADITIDNRPTGLVSAVEQLLSQKDAGNK